ncbi:hypothetical protein GQ55_1G396600 [Panicum hallii var. hallii]|uniref:Uncharacterized protein n=1 Tax=Panicum hallii var. hallii TaxID=1504633 RepID=A0A2T7FCB0_9POAL|nr:hypothetical protein GQ55_1G396600 [Panicum hallii var. hallii]
MNWRSPIDSGFGRSRSRERSHRLSRIDRGRAPTPPAPRSAINVDGHRRRGRTEPNLATHLPQNPQLALNPPSKRPADSPADEPPATRWRRPLASSGWWWGG